MDKSQHVFLHVLEFRYVFNRKNRFFVSGIRNRVWAVRVFGWAKGLGEGFGTLGVLFDLIKE